jgi:hypothetical protein
MISFLNRIGFGQDKISVALGLETYQNFVVGTHWNFSEHRPHRIVGGVWLQSSREILAL